MSGFETVNGVDAHYGVRTLEDKAGGQLAIAGEVKTLKYDWKYDDLPGGSTSARIQFVPAGAFVVDAYTRVTAAFTGGTSYNLGFEQSDGSTAIDADGLDAGVLLAEMSAVNETVVHAAAEVQNLQGIGANDAYFVVAATGTYTAGEATTYIRYIEA